MYIVTVTLSVLKSITLLPELSSVWHLLRLWGCLGDPEWNFSAESARLFSSKYHSAVRNLRTRVPEVVGGRRDVRIVSGAVLHSRTVLLVTLQGWKQRFLLQLYCIMYSYFKAAWKYCYLCNCDFFSSVTYGLLLPWTWYILINDWINCSPYFLGFRRVWSNML